MSAERVRFVTEQFASPDKGVGRGGAGCSSGEPTQPSPSQAKEGRDLALQVPNQKGEQLPAGVSPLQGQFLREAWESGIYKRVKPETAEAIYQYYFTDATYADIKKDSGIALSSVQRKIHRGIAKMHQLLYQSNPELAAADPYPLEQIKKGKDPLAVARTEKNRQQRREDGKRGGRSRKGDVFDADSPYSQQVRGEPQIADEVSQQTLPLSGLHHALVEDERAAQPEAKTTEATSQQVREEAQIAEDVSQQALPLLDLYPLLDLHRALVEVGAYEKIKNEKHRQVLEEYLTTEATQGDLKQLAGVNKDKSVNNIIHRTLQKIFRELKPEVQQQYGGSANEAIKRKASSQLQTTTSRERIKEGLTTKRWQHYREVEKPQGKPAFSEQGLENIRQGRRNTPREELSKAAHRRWEKNREQQPQSTPTQETLQTLTPKEQTIVDLTKSPQER